MRKIPQMVFSLLCSIIVLTLLSVNATCTGRFVNPITGCTIIPADSRGNESYWTKASRAVFMATAEKLHEQDKLTNEAFFNYATNFPIRDVAAFYKTTKAAAIMNADASETVMGVRSNLQANTECLTFFEETDEPFSIRHWVCGEEDGGWLFLSSPPELREEIAALMVLWTTIATDALMSLPSSHDRRLWITIDELPAIKKLPKLQTMLAEVRKWRLCYFGYPRYVSVG